MFPGPGEPSGVIQTASRAAARLRRAALAGGGAIAARWAAAAGGAWRRHEPLPARPLVSLASALVAGIAASLLLPLPPLACHGAAALALAAWCAVRRFRPDASALPLLLAVAAAGAAWGGARYRWFGADDLAWSLGDAPCPVVVEGRVVTAFQERDGGEAFAAAGLRGARPPVHEGVVLVERVRDGAVWRKAGGRAAVACDVAPPVLAPGARVRVWGRASRPAAPGNPGEFDRRARAREERRLSFIRASGAGAVERLEGGGRSWLATLAGRIRAAGGAALDRHVGPQRRGLAAALLLGRRATLPEETSASFLVTGTVHILSISGLHVALLAGGLLALTRAARVPHRPALVAVAAVTGLYMLVVGAETPVMRATLVVWLACLGAALGRRSGGLTALAAALVAVLAWHPAALLSTGTQLSFLSTAVLVGAASAVAARARDDDPIERLVERSRGPLERRLRVLGRGVLTATLVGAAVWLATAPLVAARFHLVSPVGLVLNPLVAPLVAVAMVGGFACILLAPASALLAGAAGRLCDGALGLVEAGVDLGARLPGAFSWVSGPPAWWVCGWYAGIAILLVALAPPRLARCSTWACAAALWACVGLALAWPAPAGGVLETFAASLGHGCGIVVRTPSGRVLLYDAGRMGSGAAAGRGVAALLWSAGIDRIDTLVVSHADTDHFNGVPDLLERFPVGRVVVPAALEASPAPAVAELLRVVRKAGVPLVAAAAGDEIALDPLCRVRVLHPAPTASADAPAADNETSLVLAVETAGRRVLLTGDLEGEALERFVAAGPGRCDVLVAPHHGSRASLSVPLLEATAPRWVIVSGAGGPRWPELERDWEAAAAGARVVRTEGAVHVSLTAAGTTASRYDSGRWETLGAGR